MEPKIMTVKDLIKKLESVDQNLPIAIPHNKGWFQHSFLRTVYIDEVGIDNDHENINALIFDY